ncbi:MAG: hypothetical protein K6U14_03300 [Firmicutes bacterium]|nr:hypothetical protein [Alicyclobacillaceae bacterium]MCL6496645.1 hypothetical protein [Bacillota bacterium]
MSEKVPPSAAFKPPEATALKEGSAAPAPHAPLKGRWDRDLEWKDVDWSQKHEEPKAPTESDPNPSSNPEPAAPTAEATAAPSPRPAPGAAGAARSALAEELQQTALSLAALSLAVDALDGLLHRSGSELKTLFGPSSPLVEALSQAAASGGERTRTGGDWGELLRQYLRR